MSKQVPLNLPDDVFEKLNEISKQLELNRTKTIINLILYFDLHEHLRKEIAEMDKQIAANRIKYEKFLQSP